MLLLSSSPHKPCCNHKYNSELECSRVEHGDRQVTYRWTCSGGAVCSGSHLHTQSGFPHPACPTSRWDTSVPLRPLCCEGGKQNTEHQVVLLWIMHISTRERCLTAPPDNCRAVPSPTDTQYFRSRSTTVVSQAVLTVNASQCSNYNPYIHIDVKSTRNGFH